MDQDVVPVAVPLVPLASLDHVTDVTPTLSLAVPEMLIVPDVVEYAPVAVGEVMATEGAVVSAAV